MECAPKGVPTNKTEIRVIFIMPLAGWWFLSVSLINHLNIDNAV